MIVAADLAQGDELPSKLTSLLAQDNVAYIHAHYAKYGCYAARVDRV
jgi:hypothetical protein